MDCWWSLFIVVNRGLSAPLKCRFPPFCCYSAPSITRKAQSLHFSFTWVEIINEPFIKNAPREQPGNFTTRFIFCLITAPWGEPTQTNTWGVSLGKIRGSPRATEPALDPRAATPAGKGATGNGSIQTSALTLTGSFFLSSCSGFIQLGIRHFKIYGPPGGRMLNDSCLFTSICFAANRGSQCSTQVRFVW